MEQIGFLTGKIIVAMPQIQDARFANTVIYICGHDDTGAMGLVLNRPIESIRFADLISQLDIHITPYDPDFPIHYGGPVEIGRGFVLHSNDYFHESTVKIDHEYYLTATLDVLSAMADGDGPQHALLALGYTGWSEGQLELEIQHNDWILLDPDTEIIFETSDQNKWRAALSSIGINPANISLDLGHA